MKNSLFTAMLGLTTLMVLSCGEDYRFIRLQGQPGKDGISPPAPQDGSDGLPGIGCEVSSSQANCFTIQCESSSYDYCILPPATPVPSPTPNVCDNGGVQICHKNKTKCISSQALPAHLNHGDSIGPCQ